MLDQWLPTKLRVRFSATELGQGVGMQNHERDAGIRLAERKSKMLQLRRRGLSTGQSCRICRQFPSIWAILKLPVTFSKCAGHPDICGFKGYLKLSCCYTCQCPAGGLKVGSLASSLMLFFAQERRAVSDLKQRCDPAFAKDVEATACQPESWSPAYSSDVHACGSSLASDPAYFLCHPGQTSRNQ